MKPTPRGWPRIASSLYYECTMLPSSPSTQNMMIFVDDVEAHCRRARQAGARIVSEPKTTDYGADYWTDRGYEAEDPEGHHRWFYQRLRDAPAKP